MLPRRQFLARTALALAAPVGLGAGRQDRAPVRTDKRFAVDTELVPTPVTVRDAMNRLVPGLTADDFTLVEGGQPQPITQFTAERVPLSLVLLLDTSDSMRGTRMEDARAALTTFVDDLLKPEDETALVLFNHAARIMAPWSTDRSRLLAVLAEARPSGGTAIYDAVASALRLFEARTHPRGAIVLVSDGADTASDMTVTRLKQVLGRSDIFLYGVAVDSPGAPSATAVNPLVFAELAGVSGGYAEVISSTADIAAATGRIADELNAQYMLAYTPAEKSLRGQEAYRTIRVAVKGDGYRARSRRGVVR
jgi:Ca-activated chloride channel homolog